MLERNLSAASQSLASKPMLAAEAGAAADLALGGMGEDQKFGVRSARLRKGMGVGWAVMVVAKASLGLDRLRLIVRKVLEPFGLSGKGKAKPSQTGGLKLES